MAVKINSSLKELLNILMNKSFVLINKYNLEDIYYIPLYINVNKQSDKGILKKYKIRKVI